MARMLAVCLLLTAGAVWAQVAPAPVMNGHVTIVATYGQFYTDLGAKERLCPGAEIVLARAGVIIARATVLKVDVLDSIAQLAPEFPSVVPQPGDAVLVFSNTRRVDVGNLHPPLDPTAVGVNCRPPALPGMEPDTRLNREGSGLTFAAFVALALSIIR